MSNIEVARADFLQQLKEKVAPLAFASDQAGLNGNTAEVIQIIHKICAVLQMPTSSIGLEMLAWKHQFIKPKKIKTVGYHSVLGTTWLWRLDTVVTSISDRAIKHPQELLLALRNEQFPAYVLIHQVAAHKILEKPLLMPNTLTYLAIENTGDVGSYKRMMQLTTQKEQSIRAFDLVHYLKEHGTLYGTTETAWNSMCDALARCGPCIVHLPIGRQLYDSLHLSNITEKMWRTLAQTLQKNQTFIVIEYQPKNMIFGNSSRDDKEIAHIASIMQLLHSYGVLQLQVTQ